jgi:hypothetical protein
LRPGWEINGIVLSPDELPAPSGVKVVGVDPARFLDPRALELADHGIPVLQVTTTDDFGHFRLQGLDPLMAYMIYVVGKGLFSFDPFGTAVAPNTSSFLEVHAQYLYGIKLVFRDAGDAPPKLAPGLSGRWHGQARPLGPEVRSGFAGPWTARLIGLDQQGEDGASSYDRVFFFQSSLARRVSIQFEFESALPGYDKISAQVDAPLVTDRLLVRRFEIRQSCDGFGSVMIVASPTAMIATVLASAGPNGGCRLQLRDVVADSQIETLIDAFSGGTAVVDGIPKGEYEGTILAPHQLVRYAGSGAGGMRIRIGDELAILDLPLSEWGGLEIQIATTSGTRYDGSLTATLTRVRGGESDELHFKAPPFFVPLLPAGDYTLKLHHPAFSGSAEMPVLIRQGTATKSCLLIDG